MPTTVCFKCDIIQVLPPYKVNIQIIYPGWNVFLKGVPRGDNLSWVNNLSVQLVWKKQFIYYTETTNTYFNKTQLICVPISWTKETNFLFEKSDTFQDRFPVWHETIDCRPVASFIVPQLTSSCQLF